MRTVSTSTCPSSHPTLVLSVPWRCNRVSGPGTLSITQRCSVVPLTPHPPMPPTDVGNTPVPKPVGWEKNKKGKIAPKTVDLSAEMDPARYVAFGAAHATRAPVAAAGAQKKHPMSDLQRAQAVACSATATP